MWNKTIHYNQQPKLIYLLNILLTPNLSKHNNKSKSEWKNNCQMLNKINDCVATYNKIVLSP